MSNAGRTKKNVSNAAIRREILLELTKEGEPCMSDNALVWELAQRGIHVCSQTVADDMRAIGIVRVKSWGRRG